MGFVRLTQTDGSFGLPVAGRKPDVVLREGVRVSDLTEAERQAVGLATLHEEVVPDHYDPGEPSDQLDAGGVHRTYPGKTVNVPRLQAAVRDEAERRIADGIVLASGIRFRCTTRYAVRIKELAESPVDDFPVEVTTGTGAVLAMSAPADAEAVRVAARDYIRQVLEASRTLQSEVAAGSFFDEPRNWAGWPGDGA